jgi:hypothetical protein
MRIVDLALLALCCLPNLIIGCFTRCSSPFRTVQNMDDADLHVSLDEEEGDDDTLVEVGAVHGKN